MEEEHTTRGPRRLSVIIEVSETEEKAEETADSGSKRSSGDDGRRSSTRTTTLLSPIECKATRSFLCGFVPLFLIPFPLLLSYGSFHLICGQLNTSINRHEQLEECRDINWLIPYMFFLLVSLHALVNPITSLCLNKDFKSPSPIRRLRLRLMHL